MTAPVPSIDPRIFSLLTGALGSRQSIGKVCSEFGQVLGSFLPDIVESETQLELGFFYDGCEVGLKNDLIADLDDYMILVDGSLKNWCPDFTIACSSTVIMAMVECLMGGDRTATVEPEARPASAIELQMAPMITDKIASVLKSAVNAAGNFEPMLSKPYNAAKRPKPTEDYVDSYAALIRMRVEFGPINSQFAVIVPQKTLLKTVVKAPVATSTGQKNGVDWSDVLKDQVRRSEVRVEARIHLTPLKLGAVSRLQPGDVIPFLEKGDVKVQVSANGRDLYSCEFGRAGDKYTVRVKDTAGSEEDLLRDILG
jgi:flagellar motor switch protein FliM